MDPLSDVLSLLRPSTFGFRGLDAGGDWSLAYQADSAVKCYAVQAGSCYLCLDGAQDPMRLDAGDLVLLPGGPGFRLCSAPAIAPIDAVEFMTRAGPGKFAVLNGGGELSGIGGYFAFDALHADRLLELLPPVIHVRGEASKIHLHELIGRMMRELREPLPGGDLLAQHLTQSLLIEALRLHITTHPDRQVGWLFALSDRHLAAALAAIHRRPANKWTLESLAKIAAMSRSSFAAKFRATVGESPIEYLTRWRMMMAADRLVRERMPIGRVASVSGYESESAFGAAFKRIIGSPPGQFAKATGASGCVDARPVAPA